MILKNEILYTNSTDQLCFVCNAKNVCICMLMSVKDLLVAHRVSM